MRSYLGTEGRPNVLTRRYAARHGAEFLQAPWCNITITEAARESGNGLAVLPDGDRAYTIWHAEDGRDLGRWHEGTVQSIRRFAEPGAIVFFDWAGTNTIAKIDHVGIIEKVLDDGRIQTIEGNSGDACKRRVRSAGVIAGFWNPPYTADAPKDEVEVLVAKMPLLKVGAKGTAVKRAFYLLMSHGYGIDPGVYDDMTYTRAMGEKVAAFQKAKKLTADKEIGPLTWAALISAS
ncbi:CHAP domain-containing protein [Nonomuraea typhae]|uniref:CHAP domain-containing protein n=1 Tax=Nonomuraea typhae TaxID=2603600 RepID=UPI001FE393B2|nr:CHAP domain-containing protein [Nonomuraea typhae]